VTPIAFTLLGPEIVFGILAALLAVGEVVIRIRSSINAAGSGTRPERGSLIAVVAALGIGLAAAALIASRLPGTAIPAGAPALFVTGAIVMAAGLALRWWAVILLGRSFTVEVRVRNDQQVVDRGPYAVVRHPSYTGLALVCLGFGLMLGNWLALVVVVVIPIVGLVVRIRVEERMLAEGIGEAYRRYLARVRFRLVPFVW
jgi:protein-S-isoprenylcysteine O-methyltransferase Ste14